MKVADYSGLRDGVGVSVRVRDMEVALFRRGGAVYAFENLCPHQHIPVLSEGELDGVILTCPMHGWRFDVTDGRCVHASGRLRTFPVHREGEDVFIELPDEEEEPSW
ncbi:MAG: Rieske (2Fe-2S) protein [Bacteroidota bacterium]|nr:Rieske (2Fe-2S) protein [Bacteroidota bacterium]